MAVVADGLLPLLVRERAPPQRAAPGVRSSPRRRRGCQRDRQRIAAKHHERDQPPDRPLAVGVGADELGDVPDRRSLGRTFCQSLGTTYSRSPSMAPPFHPGDAPARKPRLACWGFRLVIFPSASLIARALLGAPEKGLPFAIEALEGPLEPIADELSPEGLKAYRRPKRAIFVNSSVDVGRIALKPCLA